MGAGILPVAIHNGTIYLLFSREASHMKSAGQWSDFGGSRENAETPLQTAVREGWEESAGFLGTKREIRHLIRTHLIDKIHVSGYTTYLVDIPFSQRLPVRFAAHFRAMKKHHPEKVSRKDGLFEKDKLRWIRMDSLRRHLPIFRPWYRRIIRQIIRL